MSVALFMAAARKAEREFIAHVTEGVRALALDAYSTLQRDVKRYGVGAPVASGRYAASMRLSLNAIDHSHAPADPNYRYPPGRGARALPPRTIPNVAIAQVAARLRLYSLGQTIYISNSVPYVRRIEVGGHSWQAPGGAFGPSLAVVQARHANGFARVTRV